MLFLLCFSVLLSHPLTEAAPLTSTEAAVLLQRYGYIQATKILSDGEEETVVPIEESIEKYQKRHGLEETGEFDQDTVAELEKPRCGIPDAYSLVKEKEEWPNWKKNDLTYSIDMDGSGMSDNETRGAIKTAFSVYSAITPLTFEEVSHDNADIKILFARKDHGDFAPFYGYGGELAHALYPPKGSIHFDADEPWTVMNADNLKVDSHFDFLTMAIHEIGHALGYRNHSPNRQSIMWSQYREPRDKRTKRYVAPELDTDTVSFFKGLYGTVKHTSEVGESCDVGKLFGGFLLSSNRFMAFAHSGQQVMTFNPISKQLVNQGVSNFSDMFTETGINAINAAYFDDDKSRIMLFYRAWVWGFDFDDSKNSIKLTRGYPKRLPVESSWRTWTAFTEPSGKTVLMNQAKTIAYYIASENSVELIGPIDEVYPNMPEDVSGFAEFDDGNLLGFTNVDDIMFKYNFKKRTAEKRGSISNFLKC